MVLACRDCQPRAAERGVLDAVVREHLAGFVCTALGECRRARRWERPPIRAFVSPTLYFKISVNGSLATRPLAES